MHLLTYFGSSSSTKAIHIVAVSRARLIVIRSIRVPDDSKGDFVCLKGTPLIAENGSSRKSAPSAEGPTKSLEEKAKDFWRVLVNMPYYLVGPICDPSWRRSAQRLALDMPNNQKPYTYYRDFQNVWNTNKVQARVQSKCDGQKPTCRRCRFANAECIYALPKDIARAKQAAKEESDIKKLESSLEEMENELVKVKLILDTVKPKSKPWQITVTIDGFKIQTYITTICQLHGFFTHTANLFTTSRGPAMAFHPVGAQAMIIRLLVRRLCYHDDQKSVQLNVNRLNTPDAHGDFSVPAFMTMKMHQDFLNLVLWQT
ncbi:hypothetical protein BC936DRAFT_140842, partial [Jimgerdemannia flammicorona]